MSKLVERLTLYSVLGNSLRNAYYRSHAIYGPDERGWFCAAVDLFEPGITFRIYFTAERNHSIQIQDAERWFIG